MFELKQHQETETTRQSDDVLVKVESVSKKFCRSLKKSLWYGVKDIARELNPFSQSDSHLREQKGGNTQSLRPDEFWAVKDVSFELRRGECLGLIGHNGAGKTTLLKMLNGLIKPDGGRIEMRGRVGALIALGAGFNPILTGRENIYVNASILGLSKREIDEKLDEIIDFSDIGDFIDSPVQSYSSGMQVRLGFAVATTLRPDVLILDEILAVGDRKFRDKCYQRIGNLVGDAAVIFVSHDEGSVKRLSDRCALLHKGKLEFLGGSLKAFQRYRDLTSSPLITNDVYRSSRISGAHATLSLCEKNSISNTSVCRLELTLSISGEFLPEMPIQLYLNVNNDAAETIVQAKLPLTCEAELPQLSDKKLRVHGLCLNSGRYSLSLVCFTNNGKDILFSIRNFAEFVEDGNVTFGPSITAAIELV